MKQFLKRGLAILTAFILCLQFGKIDAQAANVVIALSASTVSVGNNVTATIRQWLGYFRIHDLCVLQFERAAI